MKRIATLFVFIFLFSTFSNQVNGILNPEFDADQSSGRQMASSFVEIASLTLNNNVVIVGDVINLTVEVNSSGCPFSDCDEYRWYLNSTGEEIDECSGVGSNYRQCTFNSTSQHIGIISVAVNVIKANQTGRTGRKLFSKFGIMMYHHQPRIRVSKSSMILSI